MKSLKPRRWLQLSFSLAQKKPYLDRLMKIYPPHPSTDQRPISPTARESLRQVLQSGSNEHLIQECLRLPRFPIKNPYVAFLRREPERFLRQNPKLTAFIAHEIRKLGWEKLLEEVQQPPELNRQIGAHFRRWLFKRFPAEKEVDTFRRSKRALLHISEKGLLSFCTEHLHLSLSKRPDFVIKAGRYYIVGEAKFLTDAGGHQDRQLDDALTLATLPTVPGVFLIAVLDGVIWVQTTRSRSYQRISTATAQGAWILSALLLPRFVRRVQRAY